MPVRDPHHMTLKAEPDYIEVLHSTSGSAHVVAWHCRALCCQHATGSCCAQHQKTIMYICIQLTQFCDSCLPVLK